jgi:hypothetical protein
LEILSSGCRRQGPAVSLFAFACCCSYIQNKNSNWEKEGTTIAGPCRTPQPPLLPDTAFGKSSSLSGDEWEHSGGGQTFWKIAGNSDVPTVVKAATCGGEKWRGGGVL